MQLLHDINWRVLERELQRSLSDRFRRVWVNYTRLGSVQFTLFPLMNVHEIYTIVTRRNFIDCNKNIFAYAKSFDATLSFTAPPTEEDRARAIEIVTAELVRVFVNEINVDLTPAP